MDSLLRRAGSMTAPNPLRRYEEKVALTDAKAFEMRSIWSGVCAALTLHRSRLPPSGAAGGRIMFTYTPCWRRLFQQAIASSPPPNRTAMIGLGSGPNLHPNSFNESYNCRALFQSRTRNSGSVRSLRKAALVEAMTDGQGDAVKIYGRLAYRISSSSG